LGESGKQPETPETFAVAIEWIEGDNAMPSCLMFRLLADVRE
jgi:hypothetical protein